MVIISGELYNSNIKKIVELKGVINDFSGYQHLRNTEKRRW